MELCSKPVSLCSQGPVAERFKTTPTVGLDARGDITGCTAVLPVNSPPLHLTRDPDVGRRVVADSDRIYLPQESAILPGIFEASG